MKKPPETELDPKPNYETIKTSLKSVARNDVVIEKLQAATKRANAIMTHGLQFLKLYLLHCFEETKPFPKLDKAFVNTVLKVSCKDATSGRPPGEKAAATKKVLREFYDEHYKPYVSEEVSYTHLNTAIDYMAKQVVTMYENNIKARFVSYVERFVNVSWGKKSALAAIKALDASSDEKDTLKKRCARSCARSRRTCYPPMRSSRRTRRTTPGSSHSVLTSCRVASSIRGCITTSIVRHRTIYQKCYT
jgi:hypothetical protein